MVHESVPAKPLGTVEQDVVFQPLPEVAVMGLQDDTAVGPVVSGAGHVVVIQSGDVGPEGVQEDTGTFVVVAVRHVVDTVPAVPGVQFCTGASALTVVGAQAVVTLVEEFVPAVHVAVGVGPVLFEPQVVVV